MLFRSLSQSRYEGSCSSSNVRNVSSGSVSSSGATVTAKIQSNGNVNITNCSPNDYAFFFVYGTGSNAVVHKVTPGSLTSSGVQVGFKATDSAVNPDATSSVNVQVYFDSSSVNTTNPNLLSGSIGSTTAAVSGSSSTGNGNGGDGFNDGGKLS